jgi:hypothetical protein
MRRMFRLSPVLIVALAVLVAAMTSFALGATSGSSKRIRACASKRTGALRVLSGKKTKCPKGTRSLSWNKTGPAGAAGRTGATGAQGPTGAPGSPGQATAFARVAADGVLEPGDAGRQNKNVTNANIEHDATTGPGVYCFGGLPFAVASAMVSPDSAGDLAAHEIANVAIQRGITLSNCDATHQQARVSMVAVSNTAVPALTDHRFQVWFEATGAAQLAPGPGGD